MSILLMIDGDFKEVRVTEICPHVNKSMLVLTMKF